MRLAFSTTFLSSALALLLASTAVSAAPQTYLTVYGEPAKYPAGFTHFDYANPNGTLFGGSLLRWIDEEAAIYAIVQLGNQRVVTKYISEINFVSASRQGDIIELGITATEFGRTSITLTCEVRNKITRKSILTVEKMVFVNLGEDGLPAPHGRTEIKYVKDQFQEDGIKD